MYCIFLKVKINHFIPFPFTLTFVFFPFTGVQPSTIICFCAVFAFETFLDGDFPSLSGSPSLHSTSLGGGDIWGLEVSTWSISSSVFGIWSRYDSESDDSSHSERMGSYAKILDIISNNNISGRPKPKTYSWHDVHDKAKGNVFFSEIYNCHLTIKRWDGMDLTLCLVSLSVSESSLIFLSSLFPAS